MLAQYHPKSGEIYERFRFDYGVYGDEQVLDKKKTKGALMYGNMIQRMSITNRRDLILSAEDINNICKHI